MKVNYIFALALLCAGFCFGRQARSAEAQRLASTPPMGWNDWAHYECHFTAGTILANARALVRSGLAARGYDVVTIDDCWMLKGRDRRGDLRPDPRRFPHGMRPVAAAIHALGLKFGIYEDAGYATCGGFAGSGGAKEGGEGHFLADARLFASWGVDYLKLDGCNIAITPGLSKASAYLTAYRAESRALARIGRPVVFSESAPAYFQGTPDWYDVLGWVRTYGQLWREGSDVAVYDPRQPDRSRFGSVMWNYDYNLQLARFQKPGNWDDADFIIGGDRGMTLAETRSQLALWSMMSAPLILSSNVDELSPAAITILGNRAVLSVDQDPLGRMATLVRRNASMDLLLKPLQDGAYAVALLNRSRASLHFHITPGDLGFSGARCELEVHELWTDARAASAAALHARIRAHDTEIWVIRPAAHCGTPARMGTVTRVVPNVPESRPSSQDYTRCLAAPGVIRPCQGAADEAWRFMPNGALRSAHGCLGQIGDHAVTLKCGSGLNQQWSYTLPGNLINHSSRLCLTGPTDGRLKVLACGHNLPSQIWTLPNDPMAETVAR
jgi:alpha-galactosidase